jgi:hypothetical protein
MTSSVPLILDKLRELIAEAPAEVRPRLLAALMIELPAISPKEGTPAVVPADSELLTPDEAAAMVRVSKRVLLRLTRGQVFRKELGHRTVRFEALGLRRWMRTRAGS